MSWAEVKRINSNFKKSLNEQARELKYTGSYLLTVTSTFTPTKTGYYKIIVVGKGGISSSVSYNSYERVHIGASGGVAISTMYLEKDKKYSVSIDSTASIFNGNIKATAGGAGSDYSVVGTATGGDFNYSGLAGSYHQEIYGNAAVVDGVSVGVFIPELMRCAERSTGTTNDGVFYPANIKSGMGILGYGASHGVHPRSQTKTNDIYPTGCVLIIPLEVE